MENREDDAEGLRCEAKDQRVTGIRNAATLTVFGNMDTNRLLEVQPLRIASMLRCSPVIRNDREMEGRVVI